ncbi:tumor necrosis factor receptor superfamily member 14-like [Engraulis encrasicolus]|uniref:tumor necrosis factor receptor superfamily member 14-like n=1 Tax=Engraulis encrasicolus TaxID=184585 RepID=UPI002FCFEC54
MRTFQPAAVVMLAVSLLVLWKTGLGLTCNPSEYEVDGRCCEMCNPGYYVLSRCAESTNTTCSPCPASTFTDTQNGLEACSMCGVCDSSAGLSLKRECSSTSDTLCEPLEGHYCTDPIADGCRGAVEHSKCNPGQYIQQQGTASTDTVCANCSKGEFSDGTYLHSCKPHTLCESLDLEVVTEGTPSHDTVCGEKSGNGLLIFGIVAAVIIFIVAFGCVYKICDHYNIRLCKIPRIFMW